MAYSYHHYYTTTNDANLQQTSPGVVSPAKPSLLPFPSKNTHSLPSKTRSHRFSSLATQYRVVKLCEECAISEQSTENRKGEENENGPFSFSLYFLCFVPSLHIHIFYSRCFIYRGSQQLLKRPGKKKENDFLASILEQQSQDKWMNWILCW